MAETSQQERTEAPTPKRREETRKKGQVVKSREVVLSSLFLGNLLKNLVLLFPPCVFVTTYS